jgi:hypothetical protein
VELTRLLAARRFIDVDRLEEVVLAPARACVPPLESRRAPQSHPTPTQTRPDP